MKCIIGLGNPGIRYRRTRHNIGSMAAESLVIKTAALFCESSELFNSYVSTDPEAVLLIAVPQTYMNESGIAFNAVRRRYDLPLKDCIVVYDDFQIPFGALRIREKGSDGGHNGLASIIIQAGSELMPRLRIGVADKLLPEDRTHDNVSGFVLSRFADDEEKRLPQLLQYSSDALLCWKNEGIAKAMSLFNKNFFNDAAAS